MAMESPLAQFEVQPLFALPKLLGVDMTITNSSLMMLVAAAAAMLFFALGMRHRAMVPGRLQSLAEMTYQFVDGIVRENAGAHSQKFFPFIFTIFLLILFMNLLGLVPGAFTPTSHVIVTLGLSMLVFVTVTLTAVIVQGPVKFLKHFVPAGMPMLLVPLVLLIELVSFLSRPISLSVRLAANMIAGHTLLVVIGGFVLPLGLLGIAPLAFSAAFIAFEVFIAILQAYVFALLSSIYLGEALADDHH